MAHDVTIDHPQNQREASERAFAMKFLSRKEAADWLTDQGLPVTWKYLQKLAHTGGGPLYRRWGNRVLYAPDDLIDWAQSKLSEPRRTTSDAA